MTRIFDITLPLRSDLPVYPGEPGPRREDLARLDRGDPANVSSLFLGLHTGTHLDAPIHFLPGGAGIDEVPLDALMGPARVIEIQGDQAINGAALVAAGAPGAERILCKTRNSVLWSESPTEFRRDYLGLAADGAEWLIAHGVQAIGIDYLSIEGFDAPGHPVHHALLGAGVAIIEGLDLRDVPPGDYFLVCLPLRLPGADGSPARAVLLADEPAGLPPR